MPTKYVYCKIVFHNTKEADADRLGFVIAYFPNAYTNYIYIYSNDIYNEIENFIEIIIN